MAHVGQPAGERADTTVVDVGQVGDTKEVGQVFDGVLRHRVTHDVANALRAAVITDGLQKDIELRRHWIIERDGDALHGARLVKA